MRGLSKIVRGSTGVPYGLVVGLVAVVGIVAVTTAGSSINSLFGTTADTLGDVVGETAPQTAAAATPTPAPASFDFPDVPLATVNNLTASVVLEMTGYAGEAISISGDGSPEFRICSDGSCSSGSFVTSGTINDGDFLQLRLLSGQDSETRTATVTIGAESDSWSVTAATSMGEVLDISGSWHPVRFVKCKDDGTVCNEAEAKDACEGVSGQLVTHAGTTSENVFSLGASNSCHHATGYFRTNDDSLVGNGNCLLAMSNVDWSGCCGTSSWHGYTVALQGSAQNPWGHFSNGANSGYNSSYTNISGGTGWGCTSESTNAGALGSCSGDYYVACASGGADIRPSAFSFDDSFGSSSGQLVQSNIVQITGLEAATDVGPDTSGLEYRICGDSSCSSIVADFTSAQGSIAPDQYLQLQAVTGAAHSIDVHRITVGGRGGTWNVYEGSPDGLVETVSGSFHQVRFVLCGTGATNGCNESVAKTSCSNIGGRLVTHAGSTSSNVFSLGASNSCHHTTGYYQTLNDSLVNNSNCLVALSNVDFSGCCGTSSWHGYTGHFQPSSAGPWGHYGTTSNSGYQANYASSMAGTGWGCASQGNAASNYSSCTAHYVACEL